MRQVISEFSTFRHGTFLFLAWVLAVAFSTDHVGAAAIASNEFPHSGLYDLPIYGSTEITQETPLAFHDSPEQIVEQLRKLCEQTKDRSQKPQKQDFLNIRNRLYAAVLKLQQRLDSHSNADAAKQWKDDLELDLLRNSLRKSFSSTSGEDEKDEPDTLQIAREAYQEIHDPNKGYHTEMFAPVKNLLRLYLTYEGAVKNENFLDEYVKYCEGIPKFVESYLSNVHPEYAPALSRATLWLSDLGLCMDSAKRISSYLKLVLGRPNLYIQVSPEFLAHAFERSIFEPIDVNECVIDTRMRGSGYVRGNTQMSFQPNDDKAQFLFRFYSQVSTNTSGVKGPAWVSSKNDSSNVSELSVFFTPDGVFASSARSQANLRSQTTGLAVKSPPLFKPLVCTIAQDQVQKRKPRYEAASQKLLEKRLNERFNKEVQDNLANFNQRYKDGFQRPLKNSGFYPRNLTFQTSSQKLLISAVLADESQVCAADTFSAIQEQAIVGESDLTVQVHQSAFNNLINQILSGQQFDEQTFCDMLEKRFPRLAQKVKEYISKNDEGDPPLVLTFAEQSPLKLTFVDQTLTIALHIDAFEQEELLYPGLDITIRFQVHVDQSETGHSQIVFKKLETTAFPPAFDPEGKVRLNTREQIIRNVVLKRLEKRLESSYQLDALELGEQWKDKGKLMPAFAFADQGWLTLSWIFR